MIGILALMLLWLGPSAYVIYRKGLTRAALFIPISLFVGLAAFFGSALVAQELGAVGIAVPVFMLLGGIVTNAAHLRLEMGLG
ncbi:hypothetical protein X769_21450 [Mesorhizobium sp. LSJC268A00]|nr:hypothetical protein X769_21450 [Mesorhizobium sp. LSJC268A00]ESY53329.1 hypothetical protein X745_18280 [Mesorhizobium sp. LNJC374B00]ESY58789.1 hypothetical protein X744_18115 [Mesorhizobium sp. LNJC372A00]ESZ04425.1 hypothetical protein X736_22170 [Mesorhizobium sp. L2C089B000]ESZ17788.1 hypothetical protein X735_12495 [Mesorhizobium sp. L2C085B000]ESZ56813.1 hypothetical protein X728_25180 [Mesorhizobium sp. L103C120A0]